MVFRPGSCSQTPWRALKMIMMLLYLLMLFAWMALVIVMHGSYGNVTGVRYFTPDDNDDDDDDNEYITIIHQDDVNNGGAG